MVQKPHQLFKDDTTRFAIDTSVSQDIAPGTVVWSAIAVAIGISVGGWFLTASIVSVDDSARPDLIAEEKMEGLDRFSTAAGGN